MKVKKVVQESTNRTEFTRAYKMYLESKGKIHCSYCGYHCNENRTSKYYGGYAENKKGIRYPNWKLVSKSRKQWMNKPIKITEEKWGWQKRIYTDITW